MSFASLIRAWSCLAQDAGTVIVTDANRLGLALEIGAQIPNCRVVNFEEEQNYMPALQTLEPKDLVIALFSLDTFIQKGANRRFSPFGKPDEVRAKFIFVRLDISRESLLQGLATPKELVYSTIDELNRYADDTCLRVTNAAGTDIVLGIHRFTTCSHEITQVGGMAFLPPSETSAEVLPGAANGRIVVDVTVGQLYHYGTLLGYFGLIDTPVTLLVENGIVTDICGGAMAAELRRKLFALPPECRVLVELGHGLSQMTPTGLIGVDESIVDTCHFGIGDGSICGVHLDVVISKPTIEPVR